MAGALAALLLIGGCMSSNPVRQSAIAADDLGAVFTVADRKPRISAAQEAEYVRALGLIEQGHHDDGIARLEDIVADVPDFTAARIDLGVALRAAGNYEAALEHLSAALRLNKTHLVALNEIGIVYRLLGRFEKARSSYEAALTVLPDFHYARRNLAVVCDLYLADLSCALDNYEAYLATGIPDPDAEMWLSDVRMRLSKTGD